jgi:hypothetical protein
MAGETMSCSIFGQRYSDGSEICTDELGYANCWVCSGGELEYRPYQLTENYPERL